jgi:hypothetical protein
VLYCSALPDPKESEVSAATQERHTLRVRVSQTATGEPPTEHQVRNRGLTPTDDPFWFEAFATPVAAANIRENGQHARGTLLTSFSPPQSADGVVEDVQPPTDAERTDHRPMVYDREASRWIPSLSDRAQTLRVVVDE